MSRAKTGRPRRILLTALLLICLLGAVLLGFFAYREAKPALEAEQAYEGIRRNFRIRETGKNAGPDWKRLKEKYPDVVGWISAPDIGIDYPVMQGETNDAYIYSLPDGSYNIAGSIFLDSKNSPELDDPLSVLYGHNMPWGNMFTPLLGYREQAFYLEHPTLLYYTPGEIFQITVFAAGQTSGQSASFLWEYGGKDGTGKREWLENLLARSEIEGVVKPDAGDKLMALCTCTKADPNVPKLIVYGILKQIY